MTSLVVSLRFTVVSHDIYAIQINDVWTLQVQQTDDSQNLEQFQFCRTPDFPTVNRRYLQFGNST